MDEGRDRALRASLEYCGSNVSIRLPVIIEGAHKVFIEDDVSIAAFVHIWGHSGVRIGRGTMIASHVAITSLTHDPNAALMRKTLIGKPVIIGEEVWIGTHAVIFPGVTIGAHAVVAAGSIVRNDVEAYTVVAGIPALALREKRNQPE